MSRGWTQLALALTLAATLPNGARASEADAFENKIEPISGVLYPKAGRFEITPTANISVNDPFFSKYLFGAKLGYHLSDYWSAHGYFVTGGSNPTGSTTICRTSTGCGTAGLESLFQLSGRIKTMAGVEVGFSPIYGKLNLIAQQVLHFDVSVLAGADYVSYQKVLGAGEARSTFTAGGRPPFVNTFGGHLGVGVRLFFAEFMALRLEFKDYLYSAEIGNPSPHNQLQRQLMAEMGLSFFFPMSPRSDR